MEEDKKIEISAEDVEITWDQEPTIQPPQQSNAEAAAAELKHDAAAVKELVQAMHANKAKEGETADQVPAKAEKPVESQGKGGSGQDKDTLKLREAWLREAWFRITGTEVGSKISKVSGISCGFGKGGSRSQKGYAIHQDKLEKGQEPENATNQVFIHPTITKKDEALTTLCSVAGNLGWDAVTDPTKVASALPPYPQHKLAEDDPSLKKDGIRQLKVICPVCGYTARTSRKWLDKAGAPYCPITHQIPKDNKYGFTTDCNGNHLFRMVEAKPIELDLEAESVKKVGQDVEVTTKKDAS